MGKTIGAVACVVVVLVLWVEALAALLHYAQAGDPGAYLVAAFVFMLLPFAAVAFVVLMVRDRGGYYDREPVPSQALRPVPERPRLEASWSQPRLVARETTTVREIFEHAEWVEQPRMVLAELRRIRPVIERGSG